MRDTRAVSSVISTILLVAVVVVLAAVVSVFALDFGAAVDETAPVVSQSSGEFVPQERFNGGVVLITHVAGETVAVSSLEISVRAECDGGRRQGRIVNLPAVPGNKINSDNIEGDDIFDGQALRTIDNNVDEVDDGGALLTDQYAAGDIIMFRLAGGECQLSDGSEVSVRIVHTPSEAVIIEQDLTA